MIFDCILLQVLPIQAVVVGTATSLFRHSRLPRDLNSPKSQLFNNTNSTVRILTQQETIIAHIDIRLCFTILKLCILRPILSCLFFSRSIFFRETKDGEQQHSSRVFPLILSPHASPILNCKGLFDWRIGRVRQLRNSI